MKPHANFIVGLFVPDLNRLLDCDILDDNEMPGLMVAPIRRSNSSVQYLYDEFIGNRIGLETAHGPSRFHYVENIIR